MVLLPIFGFVREMDRLLDPEKNFGLEIGPVVSGFFGPAQKHYELSRRATNSLIPLSRPLADIFRGVFAGHS